MSRLDSLLARRSAAMRTARTDHGLALFAKLFATPIMDGRETSIVLRQRTDDGFVAADPYIFILDEEEMTAAFDAVAGLVVTENNSKFESEELTITARKDSGTVGLMTVTDGDQRSIEFAFPLG